MASVSKDPGGRKRILFLDANRARKTIWLGKVTQSQAVTICSHVEKLVHSKTTNTAPPPATSQWLADIGETLAKKLVRVGLINSLMPVTDACPELQTFIESYITDRSSVEDSTKEIWGRAKKNLVEFFGESKRLADVTPGDAEEFWDWLINPDGAGLLESTARKRCSHACQFFEHARKKRLISENPFADVAKANMAAQQYVFVSDEDCLKVLDQLTDTQWRLLWGVSRWGGLRIGSEPRKLRWGDIDWEKGTFTVHSRKTRRYAGKETRVVPMYPELVPLFEARFAEAEEGEEYVLPFLIGRTDASLRTPILKAIEQAGVKLWPRLWQNLRATRQTELTEAFPPQAVSSFMGNNLKTAMSDYLRTYDHHYEAAAKWSTATGKKTSQNPSHSSRDRTRSGTIRAEEKPQSSGMPRKQASETVGEGFAGCRKPRGNRHF